MGWVVWDESCGISGVRWVVWAEWCVMNCVRWVVWDEWCEMSTVRRVLYDEWCAMSGVRWVVVWWVLCDLVWDEWREMSGCVMSVMWWVVSDEGWEMRSVRWVVVWWALCDKWCEMSGCVMISWNLFQTLSCTTVVAPLGSKHEFRAESFAFRCNGGSRCAGGALWMSSGIGQRTQRFGLECPEIGYPRGSGRGARGYGSQKPGRKTWDEHRSQATSRSDWGGSQGCRNLLEGWSKHQRRRTPGDQAWEDAPGEIEWMEGAGKGGA